MNDDTFRGNEVGNICEHCNVAETGFTCGDIFWTCWPSNPRSNNIKTNFKTTKYVIKYAYVIK